MDENKILPYDQVEAIVSEARFRASGDINHVYLYNREKNRQFMYDNNLNMHDLRNCLYMLRIEDYSHTSYETGKKEAHVFSSDIYGLDIYLKFQLLEDVLYITVLSFHAPQLGDLDHPYRPKKGDH